MTPDLSRRNFIKLGLLSLGSLAARPLQGFPPDEQEKVIGIGRVATSLIYAYTSPSLLSSRCGKIYRDRLLRLYEEIRSSDGPAYNPFWYRIEEGYVHSGRIQRVDNHHTNQPLEYLNANRILGQVTVPFTQSCRINRNEVWKPLYRLYYESIHWVSGIKVGPDKRIWYRLTDERLQIHYYVPALHIRPVFTDELSMLKRSAAPEDKRIVISIQDQTLTAYEKDVVVLHTKISSGLLPKDKKSYEISTETPRGNFRIRTKFPARHMGDGNVTNNPDAYELPGVPWTMFFHESGFALHGTYWHNNFGTRMSHGCVNMRNEEAYLLFRWTEPVYQPGKWFTYGEGTRVEITD
jgi:hypothetical protein